MSDRIPASELRKIQRSDLLAAITDFDSGTTAHRFADSTRFDLLVDGHRRYPPKAIVGLAAQRVLGRILTPDDFSGGESSSAFRLLFDRGFEITTKPRPVGTLDATFSIGRRSDAIYVLYESRGPNRNTDYIAGLESLLYGLADLDANLEDAVVESTKTLGLPHAERRLTIEPRAYPIRLRSTADLAALRRDLTAAAAGTGRDAESKGGGNPTKRLRLEISVPGELSLFELAELLAEGKGTPVRAPRPFEFQPRQPPHASDAVPRKGIEETVVTHLHVEMQRALYEILVSRYGRDKVAAELPMQCDRPVDLIVKAADGYEIYEIKTAQSPRECVRQALGQLLEYAYWPGSPDCRAVWVVGPSALDPNTSAYLESLRRQFGLPIGYVQQAPQRAADDRTA